MMRMHTSLVTNSVDKNW